MQAERSRVLIQVAPPGEGGVFDYLQCLKAEWAAQGVASHVLALSKESVRQRTLASIISGFAGESPCTLVLHFSGYGYGPRGLCFWLLDALEDLRARRGQTLRTVVVFHELFAGGEPPWRSAFWLARLQALIAARLARLADALWTNTELHARWLRDSVGAATPICTRPVFSNVGEPRASPAISERSAQAIVFGSSSTRQRAFDALRGQEPALHRLGIDELIEVGGGGPSKQRPASIRCREAGRLELDELGGLLQASRFGVLDYPAQYLAKSGVFAAYSAYGCVVLDTRQPTPDSDGLVAGEDYLVLSSLAGADLGVAAHQARVDKLRHWYQDHRLQRQARELLVLADVASGAD